MEIAVALLIIIPITLRLIFSRIVWYDQAYLYSYKSYTKVIEKVPLSEIKSVYTTFSGNFTIISFKRSFKKRIITLNMYEVALYYNRFGFVKLNRRLAQDAQFNVVEELKKYISDSE
jgi:hypothetical protein